MEDYILSVIEQLNKKLKENNMKGEFTPTSTVKNNGVIRKGVTYTGSKVSPVLYLDGYYKQYLETGELLIDELWDIFIKNQGNFPVNTNNIFKDWVLIRDRIIFKLVNKNLNKEHLNDWIYRDVGEELAIIYLYLFETSSDEPMATVTITEKLAENLIVSEEELHFAAMENTPRLLRPIKKSLSEVLSRLGLPLNEDVPDIMTVITNEKCLYGASTMFYPGLMKAIADALQKEVLYLIPSSIHELILVNIDEDRASGIGEIIRQVNRTEVSTEDILSDNLYQYNAVTDEISIIPSRR